MSLNTFLESLKCLCKDNNITEPFDGKLINDELVLKNAGTIKNTKHLGEVITYLSYDEQIAQGFSYNPKTNTLHVDQGQMRITT